MNVNNLNWLFSLWQNILNKKILEMFIHKNKIQMEGVESSFLLSQQIRNF